MFSLFPFKRLVFETDVCFMISYLLQKNKTYKRWMPGIYMLISSFRLLHLRISAQVFSWRRGRLPASPFLVSSEEIRFKSNKERLVTLLVPAHSPTLTNSGHETV